MCFSSVYLIDYDLMFGLMGWIWGDLLCVIPIAKGGSLRGGFLLYVCHLSLLSCSCVAFVCVFLCLPQQVNRDWMLH